MARLAPLDSLQCGFVGLGLSGPVVLRDGRYRVSVGFHVELFDLFAQLKMKNLFEGSYRNKTVLVTGHTGFKGAWLSLWLSQLGARVHGYSLVAPTQPNLYESIKEGTFATEECADIRVFGALYYYIEKHKPDFIFHLAGQPIVSQAWEDPSETIGINAIGTVNLLEVLRRLNRPCTVVVVTTDKVYDASYPECSETNEFGFSHPYSASKVMAEIAVESYRESYFWNADKIRVATARAGNVIGGGDYGHGRLIPDCVRSALAKTTINLRNAAYLRPWQYVLDCLNGYLTLGAALQGDGALAQAFNFGPDDSASVYDVADKFSRLWPAENWLPISIGHHSVGKEDKALTLETNKAKRVLKWAPRFDLNTAIRETVDWYVARHCKESDMLTHSVKQIETFIEDPALVPQ